MVAMSDTYPEVGTLNEADEAKMLRETMRDASRVNHAGRIFFGAVLSISAAGMWLVPVAEGDAAMQLIKLLVSVVMLGLGVMFIFSARETNFEPEVIVDTTKRELHLIRQDGMGNSYKQATHPFSTLREIKLDKRQFSASDAEGQELFSVRLQDKAIGRALEEALDGLV